jgi:aspartate racemase
VLLRATINHIPTSGGYRPSLTKQDLEIADNRGEVLMKTIGLLGGMSWESTALYYRLINEGVKEKLGGLHSARIAMVSLDFQEIEELQHTGKWDRAGEVLREAARRIEAAGADFLVLCTNTMHKVVPQIERAINIPILHLADATARRIKKGGMKTVGLLGTNFTMEEDFYRGRLIEKHGLNVIIPPTADRKIVHRIIYEELCRGIVKPASRKEFLRIINRMRKEGAEGVIEACTEIVMLVQQQHTDILLFDTTAIHAQEAVAVALS